MTKKAVIIGIDHYSNSIQDLNGCINDAKSIGKVLGTNDDSDKNPNFSIKYLTSDKCEVTTKSISESIKDLFSSDAEIALLYFAGHGVIHKDTNQGYIVSQNGSGESWGMSIADIIGLANKAYPNIKSSIIILDCCHSGCAGNFTNTTPESISSVGTGVTILTACKRDETADEVNGQGLFTSILLDGLNGGAADILGNITPASLYTHVDQTLGAFEQRPIYKTNVHSFVSLRQVMAKVPLITLRKIAEYFPEAGYIFELDPSYEPDRENVPDKFKDLPVNETNTKIFGDLQLYFKNGLVEPIGVNFMYYAAMESTGCKLTAHGKHYWKLAKKGKF